MGNISKLNLSTVSYFTLITFLIAVGRINVSQTINGSRKENNSEVEAGGYWKPSGCYSRDRVAIVIPFRDRQTHLNILLKYLHPLLQRQQIEYRIFVVEQVWIPVLVVVL